ncbi:MAG: hypothetical protein B6I38_10465 [Anaerolineaceae bacterium 4572_5.1]|nr:MAG: hypothetical protein B6I38_10465 [Anaerolineaceae bacterium 4572_5.1]
MTLMLKDFFRTRINTENADFSVEAKTSEVFVVQTSEVLSLFIEKIQRIRENQCQSVSKLKLSGS